MAASMNNLGRYLRICPYKSSFHQLKCSQIVLNSSKLNYVSRYTPIYCIRCQSTQQPEDKVKPPTRPRRYLLDRLVNFITTSADKLEKRIPSVFQVYRTFKTGITAFVGDTKDFYRVSTRLWGGESLESFSRKELELYRQFSSDLPIVGLAFIIAFAPGGAAVFPIAYVFPRYLLSHHFWTPQQKEEFRRLDLIKQVKHFDSILDYLHLLSQHIHNDEVKRNVRRVIGKLDSQVVLSTNEIKELYPLFEGKPYNMDCLSLRHRRHLGKSLGLSLRRNKLVKDALLLHYMDMAMVREGIHSMTEEELDKACAWRGLNPQGLRRGEKMSYLEHWTQISSLIHEPSISLLLHLPVLQGYCHPANRELMGTRSSKPRGRL